MTAPVDAERRKNGNQTPSSEAINHSPALACRACTLRVGGNAAGLCVEMGACSCGPIEFSTMTSNDYFETLLSTFAVLNDRDDHTCLSAAKSEDRIRMFEEYACAGLSILRKELDGYNGSIVGFVETRIVNQVSSFQENLD